MIDKANRRKQIGEPDGSLWTFDYNQRGEVTRGEKQNAAGNPLDGFRFTYQYDHIGNRITATTGAPDLVASYVTNTLNQYAHIASPQTDFVRGTAPGAASVTVNGQSIPLGSGGSFNARVTGSGPATIVATAADGSTSTEARTVALSPATFAPQYDADGNLLSDGLWTYTWDGENRLIALESTPANPLPQRIFKRFSYDSQSRRISEERFVFDPAAGAGGAYVLEKAQRWIYDGWNQTLELLNDRPARVYVWGLDLSGTRDGAGGVGGLLSLVDLLDGSGWNYLCDGNGNVAALADGATGTIVGSYKYSSFAELSTADGPAARENRFRFSSKIVDLDSGLVYYGFRKYHPRQGRWPSRDPIEEAGGVNLYGFVANDPIRFVDPLGEATYTLEGTFSVTYDQPVRVGAASHVDFGFMQNWVLDTRIQGPLGDAYGFEIVVDKFQLELHAAVNAKNNPHEQDHVNQARTAWSQLVSAVNEKATSYCTRESAQCYKDLLEITRKYAYWVAYRDAAYYHIVERVRPDFKISGKTYTLYTGEKLVTEMNPHHPTPTGASWAGGLQKENPFS